MSEPTSSSPVPGAPAAPKPLTDFSIDSIMGPCGAHMSVGRAPAEPDPLRPARQDAEPPPAALLQAPPKRLKHRAKNFQCPACKMAFSNNGQLKNHVRIHTGERPFQCNHSSCNKTFTRNEELTRHKLIHTGFRPHTCANCGKRFGRKDHLKKHAKTHDRKRARRRVSQRTAGPLVGPTTTPHHLTADHHHQLITCTDQMPPSEPAGEHKLALERLLMTKSTHMGPGLDQLQAPVQFSPTTTDFTGPNPLPNMLANTPMRLHTTPTKIGLISTPPPPPPVAFPQALAQLPGSTFLPLQQPAIPISLPNLAKLGEPNYDMTATVTSASAIQQMARDCWNKWYSFIGMYQQQQVFASSVQEHLNHDCGLFTRHS